MSTVGNAFGGNAFTVNWVDIQDGNLNVSVNRTILPSMANCLTKHRHSSTAYKQVSGFIPQLKFVIDVLYENRGVNNQLIKGFPVIANDFVVNGSFPDRCATEKNPIVIDEVNMDDNTVTLLIHKSMVASLANAFMNCSHEMSRSNAPAAIRALGYSMQNASDVLFGLLAVESITTFPVYSGEDCVANENLVEEVSVA